MYILNYIILSIYIKVLYTYTCLSLSVLMLLIKGSPHFDHSFMKALGLLLRTQYSQLLSVSKKLLEFFITAKSRSQ